MTHHEFDRWLKAYGAAWEARDAEAFAALPAPPRRSVFFASVGGEEQGLRRINRESCHDLVRIPMGGTVETLNVSGMRRVTSFAGEVLVALANAEDRPVYVSVARPQRPPSWWSPLADLWWVSDSWWSWLSWRVGSV